MSMSSSQLQQLAHLVLADGGYTVLPWRQCLWPLGRGRREGVWLAGIALFLVCSGLVPLTFVMMTLLAVLAVATCLRAYALHEYARQLTELAMQEQQSGDNDAESSASGSAAATGGSTPARRRPRRPSLLTAVATSRPLSLLNLRLSLMDRDFTEHDFDLLVRLDELEAASRQDPAPPPLPEAQLALLPVHVHRSPPSKKGKGKQPVAALHLEPLPVSKKAAPGGAAGTPGVLHIPVLVEAQPPTTPGPQTPQQQGQRAALLRRSESGGKPLAGVPVQQPRPVAQGLDSGTRAAYPCCAQLGGAGRQGETPPAAASPRLSESEGDSEEEAPLCSICLDPFEDGAKVLSLPCRHQYHAECVTQWLRLKGLHSTCPNCKGTVFRAEEAAAAAVAAAR